MGKTDDTMINRNNILKSAFVAISAFIWIYFLVYSGLTMHSIVVFDLSSIFNSISTTHFVLFLIFFPLTSVIILSVIFNSSKTESLFIVILSLALTTLISSILFGLNILFILFLILYIVAHVIFCLIVRKDKDNMYNLSVEWLSKLIIFFVIVVFLCSVIYLLPSQKEKVHEFEVGIVNLFIAEDLEPWINASQTISRQCTNTNLKYIMSSEEYIAISKKTDPESINFHQFMDNLKESVNSKKKVDEIKDAIPSLDTPVVKAKILDTIKAIPFMGIIENHFAFFFSIIFTSLVYSYLSIVFLILAATIYLFNKIFKEERQ